MIIELDNFNYFGASSQSFKLVLFTYEPRYQREFKKLQIFISKDALKVDNN